MLNSRARAPRWLITCVTAAGLMAALAVPVSAQAAGCAGEDLVPDAANAVQVADATLCLINAERAAAGLVPLSAEASLSSASTAYAADMVAGGFFAHESPDGGTLDQRLARVGYRYEIAGENIAWGEASLSTPASIVDAWMHSEGHRANIMEAEYRQIGLGVVTGVPRPTSIGGATYVTDFGTPEHTADSRGDQSEQPSAPARVAPSSRGPVAHYATKRQVSRRAHGRRHHRGHSRRAHHGSRWKRRGHHRAASQR